MAAWIGGATAGTLTALAALHVFWAVRGAAVSTRAVPTKADGAPLFMPGRGATLVVAALLAAAAALLAGRMAGLAPAWVFRVGSAGVGVVLAARAVGDFRWVGFFKRARRSEFARRDTWVYSPLCAALATGCAVVAAG